MKSILLHVHDDPGLDSRPRAACDVPRATSGHIHCVKISAVPDFVAADMYGGAALAPEILAALDEMDDKVRLRIGERLTREGANRDWRHLRRDTVSALLSSAALSDLFVVTLPKGPRRDYRCPQPIAADAFGRSRLRQVVPGGVTWTILRQASLPLLLAH